MTEDGEMLVDVDYGSGRIKGTGGYAKTGSLNPSRLLHKLEMVYNGCANLLRKLQTL